MSISKDFTLVPIHTLAESLIDDKKLEFCNLANYSDTIICDLFSYGVVLENGALKKFQMNIIRTTMKRGFVLESWEDPFFGFLTELNCFIDSFRQDAYSRVNLFKGNDRFLFRRTVELLTSPDENYSEIIRKVFSIFTSVFSAFELTCWLREIFEKRRVLHETLIGGGNDTHLANTVLSFTGDLFIENEISKLKKNI